VTSFLSVLLNHNDSKLGSLSNKVRGCLQTWRRIGAPCVVRRWIRYGYRFQFAKLLRPFRRARIPKREHISPLRLLIADLLSQGTLGPAESVDFVSHCRLEPKKDGSYRLIVDLRHVNEHLRSSSCKYESAGALVEMLAQGDWMFSLDLKSGYYHVGIHPRSRRFATILVDGQYLCFTELMFGLRPACLVFTKFMRPVVAHLRKKGVRVHPYLDDFLFAHQSVGRLLEQRDMVAKLLLDLGLTRNVSKGQWIPTQRLEHLGYLFDTDQGRIEVPPRKAEKIRVSAARLLAYAKTHRAWVSKDRLAELLGQLMSLTLAFPEARTRCQELFSVLNSLPGWNRDVQIRSRQAWRDLEFLSGVLEVDLWLPLRIPAPSVTMTTDASLQGWGVTLGIEETSGLFLSDPLAPIAVKEFRAVLYGLTHFQAQLQNLTVRVLIDNQNVLHAIRKGASRSAALMGVLREVQLFCRRHNVTLHPEYIQSRLNMRADALSRLIPHAEWSLSALWFGWLERVYGPRDVDRFATWSNRKCVQFNCLTSHPNSLGDALHTSWNGVRNYVCPPFALVPQAVQRIKADRAEAVLVAPFFPAAPWWPALVAGACCIKVLSVPQTTLAVIAPQGVVPEPTRNPRWRLCISYFPGSDPATPPSQHCCSRRNVLRQELSTALPGAST
jgi:hypothetical protein